MGVLVTGGAGYVGSHMVYELAAQNELVVVLDDLSTGFAALLPSNVPFFMGKVGDAKLVASIIKDFKIDAVLHFAGASVVAESISNPFFYFENNTAQSRSLFETAVTNDVKHIVFSSSACVYGNPDRLPVPETAALSPLSPYASSQLMTEVMLRDASSAYKVGHVVLRYVNAAGADPLGRTGQSSAKATGTIKHAVQTALRIRKSMSIFGEDYDSGDGTCVRDYVHVTDVVKAHSAALRHLRSGGDSATLNVGYGHGFSVREVIDAVQRVSGVRFPVKIGPTPLGDLASLVVSNDRIMETLDWRPRHDDLDEIVMHALRWEKKLLAGKGATGCLAFPPTRETAWRAALSVDRVFSPLGAIETPPASNAA